MSQLILKLNIFGEVLKRYEAYLVHEKAMKPRSVRDYVDAFARIQSKIDLLGEPTYKQVNDAIRLIREETNASQNTIYKFSICVRGITKWLEREQYTIRNVFPYSDWKKPRPNTPKFLTVDQFKRIENDPFLNHQERTLLYLFWDSAGRISEVCSLNQDDFFFDVKFYVGNVEKTGHYVRISYEISKGHYSYRNVPFSDKLKDLLLRQFEYVRARGHTQAVFIGSGDLRATVSGISKVLHNIGMRNSPFRPIMHLSAHQFRHSAGIRWLELGVPQLIVQKWLGHDGLDMTSKYINICAQSSLRIYSSVA